MIVYSPLDAVKLAGKTLTRRRLFRIASRRLARKCNGVIQARSWALQFCVLASTSPCRLPYGDFGFACQPRPGFMAPARLHRDGYWSTSRWRAFPCSVVVTVLSRWIWSKASPVCAATEVASMRSSTPTRQRPARGNPRRRTSSGAS